MAIRRRRGPGKGFSKWPHVALFSLVTWIDGQVKKVSRANSADQSIDPSGRFLDTPVQQFEVAPDVAVTLKISPAGISPAPKAVIDREADVVARISSWPATTSASRSM